MLLQINHKRAHITSLKSRANMLPPKSTFVSGYIQLFPLYARSTTATTNLQTRPDIDMNRLRISITRQPSLSQLASDTRLLHTTKRHPEIRVIRRVDPNHPRLQLPRNAVRTHDILCEDRRAETVDSLIGHLHGLLLSLERRNDDEGPEDLLLVDRHARLDIREDGGLDEVALSVADVGEGLAATDELGALVLAGLGEAEHALVLRLGDLWALGGGLGEWVADNLDLGDVLCEFGDEGLVDAFLDEDTGRRAADLALVGEDTDVL